MISKLFQACLVVIAAGVASPSAQAGLNPALAGLGYIYDLNGDVTIDALDIDMLTAMFSTTNDRYDLNGDGLVNGLDLEVIIKGVLQVNFGDANLDGSVDAADVGKVRANLGQADNGWADGDFNGDGAVDAADVGLLRANLGKGAPNFSFAVYIPVELRPTETPAATHMPAPTALPWLFMGLAALRRYRRPDRA